jgi:hypothetical protein
MNYFQYLKLSTSVDDLRLRLGETLDAIMSLDLNLVGRTPHLLAIERKWCGGPVSLAAVVSIEERVPVKGLAIFVTGCSVRPDIDPTIGEPDGPPGVAALARALFITKGAHSLIVVAKPLVAQVAATLKAAGATVVSEQTLRSARTSSKSLFAVSVVGLPVDENVDDAIMTLLDQTRPDVVFAVEHLGFAADGKAYFSTGVPFETAVLQSNSLFVEAQRRGTLTISCIDNPNEVGTARLHSSVAKHPSMSHSSDHIVPACTVNWSAYAIAAGLGALAGTREACFTEVLDFACTDAVLRHGAIDPFSGLAEPQVGIDGMDLATHGLVTTLMARAADGYIGAMAQAAP